jgi:hypothetical protein
LSAPEPTSEAGWFESDPLWYRRAVFYEVDVRAFSDADGDGYGDLRGIRDKLEYLQWLGIDCIWVLMGYWQGLPGWAEREYACRREGQERDRNALDLVQGVPSTA